MNCFCKRKEPQSFVGLHFPCVSASPHPSPYLSLSQAALELAIKLTEPFECCGKAGNQQKAPFMSMFVDFLFDQQPVI